jgi:hypothetical protein
MPGASSVKDDELYERLPWITEDGFFDPAKLPIDPVLKQAVSNSRVLRRSGLSILQTMYRSGRAEAGVFLLDLLVNCDDHWEKRTMIVDALTGINTKRCADLLFGELKRVKSSNTTRRYLDAVLKVLASMPAKLVEDRLESLADDKSFSPKMRAKFRLVLEKRFRAEEYW